MNDKPTSVESRFKTMRGSTLSISIFVEREEESEILFRRWQRARAGEGQIAPLCTGLGRGKSRLTATLLEQIAADRRTRLRGR